MKKIKITTPENIELEVVLAEVLSRAAAGMIDLIIQGIVIFFMGCALFKVIDAIEIEELTTGFLIGGYLILSMLLIYGYHIFFEMKWNGQTIGKRLLGLRVIRNNGGPITVRQVIIRNLFRIVLDYTGVGVILIFMNKGCKRLGDMVAGTMVIVEEKQERPMTLDYYVEMDDELKSCLTQEEYNLLREYFTRKETMTNNEVLRHEMKDYFKNKLVKLGLYEKNEKLISKL